MHKINGYYLRSHSKRGFCTIELFTYVLKSERISEEIEDTAENIINVYCLERFSSGIL